MEGKAVAKAKRPAQSSKAAPKTKKADGLRERLTTNAPTPLREDPKNLRQRSQWFQRRSSGS